MKTLRALGPWLLGAALLCGVIARVDRTATLAALREADLVRYLPLALGFCLLWLALDAFALRALFARAGADLPFRAMLRERAATYPWMALSFDLANAALVAGLYRATRAPLAGLAAAMLAHYACDLVALFSLSAAASWTLEGDIAALLRPVALALACGATLVLVGARLGVSSLGRGPLASALRAFRTRDLARLIALRWAFYASFALFVWSTTPCFGIDVPFRDVLARMPLVQSVAALPIAPGGLGTAQAAMLALFAGFGPPARWLAYSLVYGATLVALRLPLGFALFGRRVELAH